MAVSPLVSLSNLSSPSIPFPLSNLAINPSSTRSDFQSAAKQSIKDRILLMKDGWHASISLPRVMPCGLTTSSFHFDHTALHLEERSWKRPGRGNVHQSSRNQQPITRNHRNLAAARRLLEHFYRPYPRSNDNAICRILFFSSLLISRQIAFHFDLTAGLVIDFQPHQQPPD